MAVLFREGTFASVVVEEYCPTGRTVYRAALYGRLGHAEGSAALSAKGNRRVTFGFGHLLAATMLSQSLEQVCDNHG